MTEKTVSFQSEKTLNKVTKPVLIQTIIEQNEKMKTLTNETCNFHQKYAFMAICGFVIGILAQGAF